MSNGYVVVGGPATSEDIQCCPPQQLPDVAPPNNVLAPFWADLTGEGLSDPAPDGIFVEEVTFGPGADYVVVELRLNAYGTDDLKVFQLWLGQNGVQDISFNYDPDHTNLDGLALFDQDGGLTIGAENENGTGGDQLDEAPEDDNLPEVDLAVVSTDPEPGDSVTLGVDADGVQAGDGVVRSELTSPAVLGTTIVRSHVQVIQPTSDIQAFITQLYVDFVGRDPNDHELEVWTDRLASGQYTRLQFTTALSRTNGHRGLVVDHFFDLLLDRAPTGSERTSFIGRLRDGMAERTLVARLAGTQEFYDLAGGTDEGFVDRVYDRLLNRAPTAAGRQRWVDRLAAGTTRSEMALTVYQTLESRRLRVDALYDQLLGHPPSAERRAHFAALLTTMSDSDVAARLAATNEYFNNAQ